MLLAQDTSGAYTRIVIASLALIVVVVLGFLVVSWVRSRVKNTDMGPAAGFTLSYLRRLHKSGQMTDEEFERAKAKIIAVAKSPLVKETDPGRDDVQGPTV